MLLKDRIAKELEKIKEQNGGMLRQEAIVEFAKNPKTALHTQFDWDDTEAARKWRLEQAGRIMRLQVRVIEEGQTPVRALVSLSTDRTARTGYRSLTDVLADPDLSAQLLADVHAELQATRRKFSELKALTSVWQAIDAVQVPQQEPEAARSAA